MRVLRITIKAEPTAKGRAKTSYRNGKVWTYTPAKTQNAEKLIRDRLVKYQADCFPPHTPVNLSVVFYRTRCEWQRKKCKLETMPVRKPDTDNFLKLLLDAINGLLVSDDAQITTIHAKKRWTDKPYGYITIYLTPDKGE